MTAPPGVLVYGIDAVGQFLAATLAAARIPVHCVGQPAAVRSLHHDGLQLERVDGRTLHVAPGVIGASESMAAAGRCELVLLTVGGPETLEAGAELERYCAPGTPVISLLGGVDDPDRLRASAPSLQVVAGMLTVDVTMREPGRLAQTSPAQLVCARTAISEAWAARLAAAGLPLSLVADMPAAQWGRLLLQLSDLVGVLSGAAPGQRMREPGHRALAAALQAEALGLLRRAAIRPARLTPLPPALLPWLQRLPTPLYRMLAGLLLDAPSIASRSAPGDRRSELDALCGAVVRLAASLGGDAPVNRALLQRVGELDPGLGLDAAQVATLLAQSLESRSASPLA